MSSSTDSLVLTDRLIEQFQKGVYECMVCCESITRKDRIWSCSTCYQVFHISCLEKWGLSKMKKGFMCPAGCQTNYSLAVFTLKYTCWCKKVVDPSADLYDLPHSCGELCNKTRNGTMCEHLCSMRCHPGPCPRCTLTAIHKCHCGQTEYPAICSELIENRKSCTNLCSKTLECKRHLCAKVCHPGECPECEVLINLTCHCGKVTQDFQCKDVPIATNYVASKPKKNDDDDSEELISNGYTMTDEELKATILCTFSCRQKCNKLLDCKNHRCDELCHDGPCPSCKRLPRNLNRCGCGKESLWTLYKEKVPVRKECTDPVPTCGKTCERLLGCGIANHSCRKKCHDDECGDCVNLVNITCRCGSKSTKVPCVLLYKSKEDISPSLMQMDIQTINSVSSKENQDCFIQVKKNKQKLDPKQLWIDLPYLCGKKCKETKSCGKHKCDLVCCPSGALDNVSREEVHSCTFPCHQVLSCGYHRCEEFCHKGPCPPCLQSCMEEVHCPCGATVLEPPIPCGTFLPECPMPCTKIRPCGHPAAHNCHPEGECPPCPELMLKTCAGGHTLQAFRTPCHQKMVVCNEICKRMLPCGVHRCDKTCHNGDCKEGATDLGCGDPCWKKMSCGHICQSLCHGRTDCVPEACTVSVPVLCKCGRTRQTITCAQYMDAKKIIKQRSQELADQWVATARDAEHRGLPSPPPPSGLDTPVLISCTALCSNTHE